MIFRFSPQRSDAPRPVMSVSGDVLTLDGEDFDLSPLGADESLPGEAFDHDLILGARNVAGEIEVSIILPVGPIPTAAQAFPEPLTVTSGSVNLP